MSPLPPAQQRKHYVQLMRWLMNQTCHVPLKWSLLCNLTVHRMVVWELDMPFHVSTKQLSPQVNQVHRHLPLQRKDSMSLSLKA